MERYSGLELKTAGTNDWGLRWQEFDRNDRIVNKEKFFKTKEAREAFSKKIEQGNLFNQFLAWSDPKESQKTSESKFVKYRSDLIAELTKRKWQDPEKLVDDNSEQVAEYFNSGKTPAQAADLLT